MMPMTGSVSICIPCYNAALYVGAALESALAQTWSDTEIIVVDDGSTDNSAEVLARYADRGVKVIHQPNRGQCAAANSALAAARGDYIKFFDADDLLSPNAIADQVAALAGRRNRLAHAAWARFHDDPAFADFTSRPCWHDAPGLDWIKETWIDTEPMYQCGIWLIPRSLLETTGGWDERLSLINDFEFFTRLVLASEGVVFTPEARLYYRSGLAGSLSGQKTRRAWESAVLSTNLAVDHLLAREDTAETRQLSANMLQALIHSLYPKHPDLRARLAARVRQLGGSDLAASGGPNFQRLARFTGWRVAAWLRYVTGRRQA